MLETIDRLKSQEDSYSTHASAFAGWLATKSTENDVRKALLLGAREQLSVCLDERPNGLHRAIIVVVDDEPHVAVTLSERKARLSHCVVH